MWHKDHLFPITNFFAHVAVRKTVTDIARREWLLLARRRFEQRRFKGKDLFAARACTFGKQYHQAAPLKRHCNLVRRSRCLRSSLPVNEYRASQTRKPPEYRPVSHLALGYENRRRERPNDENIQITEVVANQQTFPGNGPKHLQFDFEYFQEPP